MIIGVKCYNELFGRMLGKIGRNYLLNSGFVVSAVIVQALRQTEVTLTLSYF